MKVLVVAGEVEGVDGGDGLERLKVERRRRVGRVRRVGWWFYTGGKRCDSCGNVNDFVLSLLPELGTMGSKWGGVGVTRSSTS